MNFPSQVGAYPLLGVGKLPNADVASPGEVWTNQRANGIIVPGSAIIPVNIAGALNQKAVAAGDVLNTDKQVAVALRQISVPDINLGSIYNPWLGPNEIVNLGIPDQDYVRSYHTGVLHLTLVVPDVAGYVPGELVGWNPAGVRPAGKAAGAGAWDHAANAHANTSIFEVRNWRPYGTAGEGILTVRFLRSNQ